MSLKTLVHKEDIIFPASTLHQFGEVTGLVTNCAKSPDLTLWCLIKAEYSSVGGDVPVDSEAPVMTSSISRPVGSVIRRSLLKILIRVRFMCMRL
jgi:hypothetical protein